jgi:hypothetical protein
MLLQVELFVGVSSVWLVAESDKLVSILLIKSPPKFTDKN